MALQAAYARFVSSPAAAALADDASLHYITTTTSFTGAANIVKHLAALRNQVRKKSEDVLEAVEGPSSLAIEFETSLEFVTSGAVYLPGLDDNFLSDRIVILPIMHVVTFDPAGKISRIRQSWDQGALLKQLDVIGKTGRNWPIRDSKEQIRIIASGVRPIDDSVQRSRGNSTNIMRDPHTTLHNTLSREELEAAPAAVVSPRGGSRPAQRSFTDILGDQEIDPRAPTPGRVAPKAGAGKNYQPMRLFDAGDDASRDLDAGAADSLDKTPDKQQRFYKPNPKKYQHFDFADGPGPQDSAEPGVEGGQKNRAKHASQWSFDDFVTPQRPKAGKAARHQDVRHWSTETDDAAVEKTPARPLQQQFKPRRDAETHFELQDDGIPSGEPRLPGRAKGSAHNEGLGLYQNNVVGNDGASASGSSGGGGGGGGTAAADPRALGNITNLKDRTKDFDAHFRMTDDSPSAGGGGPQAPRVNPKAYQIMDANWAPYDRSPTAGKTSRKENKNSGVTAASEAIAGSTDAPAAPKIYHTSGDGMGGRKTGGRGWSLGDDPDADPAEAPVPGRKQGSQKTQAKGNLWDF